MVTYTYAELLDYLGKAIIQTRDEEGSLIKRRVNERVVTHRVALHLQASFPHHHVDCEYNRNMTRPKAVEINLMRITAKQRQEYVDKLTSKRRKTLTAILRNQEAIMSVNLYPDVIVHHRESNDQNLIVIEFKFKNDRRGNAGRLFDIEKLRAYTNTHGRYRYYMGVFVELERTEISFTIVHRGAVIGGMICSGLID